LSESISLLVETGTSVYSFLPWLQLRFWLEVLDKPRWGSKDQGTFGDIGKDQRTGANHAPGTNRPLGDDRASNPHESSYADTYCSTGVDTRRNMDMIGDYVMVVDCTAGIDNGVPPDCCA
jgi:hypothetical protein